jgi:CDP-diacylglycerol--serine O-phosphatidyltransferase
MLDGRVARFGGNESPFGREFDSIADIVSFGVAPALLVYKFVLSEIPGPWGLVIALLYLLCGALRLARFNCVAAAGGGGTKDFTGFPIPAAAGVICSITLFLLWFYENDREIGSWKFILPPLMVFLAFMMFSKVRYPSFKALNWRTQRSIPKFIAIILTLTLAGAYLRWSLAIVFLGYLLYGFFRPFISARMRKEIEEEEEEGVA